MLLIDSLEKHGENWEEIVKAFEGRKTKQECLLHLIQLPIKDSVAFKINENLTTKEGKTSNLGNILPNAVNDINNPIISQVTFFCKMFEKFVDSDKQKQNLDLSSAENIKEIIYKTYSKSIDVSKGKKKSEKKKMENIMNMLIYLQMKKIEKKLEYFNDFEKLIQYETQQMKSMESQIIQDRIKLAMKKSEMMNASEKLKKAEITLCEVQDLQEILPQSIKVDNDIRILDINP
jgi:hypothetical protein